MQTHALTQAVDVRRGNARESSEALALDARRAAAGLGLSAPDLEALLEIDASTAASIRSGGARIQSGSALATRVLLLVRLQRALGVVYGWVDQANQWLDAVEPSLGDKPRVLLRTHDGLGRVVSQIERRCKDCLW